MNSFQRARIRQVIAEAKSDVPIHLDGGRLVIIRPSGLMLLDRAVVADVEPMTGDRLMVTMEALLPLSPKGWPDATARRAFEMFRAAVEGDND